MTARQVERGGVSEGSLAAAPEHGWEDRAAGWVQAGALAAAAGVALAWGVSMVAPLATGPAPERVALEAERNRKKGQDCADCADCAGLGCDAADCIDCGCEAADCAGCEAADCGGLDCGGCDVACAVAPRSPAGAVACRRGPPVGSALVLAAPLALLAVWRRGPRRRAGASGGGGPAGGQGGGLAGGEEGRGGPAGEGAGGPSS